MTRPRIVRQRRTKIVATIGPASGAPAMLAKLFEAGVDVFRMNFSHGTHAAHAENAENLREMERRYGYPVCILADLQGPKLRVGRFRDGAIELKPGQNLRFDLDPAEGDEARVNLPHPEVIEALGPGSAILLDDGKVRVEVREKGPDFLDVEVLSGKRLSNNKGFNVPGVILPVPALTEKDRKDLDAALEMGVDWIAQSFVQQPGDVAEARRRIAGRAALLIKIEKPSALDHLDALVDMADGVMLARGDLGVEIPPEDVPSTQKHVVRMVRERGKPVIVATQMLESMIESPAPTRAEASDVATAVYDGTDAVMLSAETATGKYPLEAVSIMDRICRRVENDPSYARIMNTEHPDTEADPSDAITAAAYHVARDIRAACIATYTTSGSTALRTARQRPQVITLCLTQNAHVARRLSLSYGIHPVHVTEIYNFDDAVKTAVRIAREQELTAPGRRLVITAGVPFNTPGSTNTLRIAWVE